jgi:hypothetical protein
MARNLVRESRAQTERGRRSRTHDRERDASGAAEQFVAMHCCQMLRPSHARCQSSRSGAAVSLRGRVDAARQQAFPARYAGPVQDWFRTG